MRAGTGGLTQRERALRALCHQPVDRLPTQVNFTAAMGRRLAEHWGVPVEELPARLDNHLLRVDVSYPGRLSPDGKVRYDLWGVGFSTQQEGYHVAVHPLSSSKAMDGYPWPNPHDARLLDDARQAIEQNQGQYLVTCNMGFCLFERAWALRGFESFLLDLVLDPIFAEDLLERITIIELGFIQRFLSLGLDAGYFGDDYGAQSGLLFSPTVWRRLFKPRLARLFAPFRQAGLPVVLHSDGDIREIVPDLIDIGVTVLNPVQPEVVDHDWLRRTFGRQLAYYGGVSTQAVLPYGNPGQVSSTVANCVRRLAPGGTGLLLGPSHRLMSDVPLENVEVLLRAMSDYGGER